MTQTQTTTRIHQAMFRRHLRDKRSEVNLSLDEIVSKKHAYPTTTDMRTEIHSQTLQNDMISSYARDYEWGLGWGNTDEWYAPNFYTPNK